MMCRNDKSGVGPRWKYNTLAPPAEDVITGLEFLVDLPV